ncbi:MAG: hypothetical protein JST68_02850 [Bacteroidetes bacterium]|nr:hypothetical protein [Bacteroidota bacterium]
MKLTRKILIASTGTLLSAALVFTACKKDSSSTSSQEPDAVSLTTSSATADDQYNDVLNVALQVGSGGSTTLSSYVAGPSTGNHTVPTGPGGATPCAVLSVAITDTTKYPVTVSIDFGTGCTGTDGVVRKGKVTYVFSGKIYVSGTTVTASFDNYSVNGYQLAGTYSITNNSIGNGISFVTKVTDGKITFPDASYYAYAGTRTVSQTGGVGTLTVLDDSYSITGSHSFSSSAGKSLTDSITTPLLWQTTCRHIGSGVIGFTYSDGALSLKGTLDYGTGTCDNTATIKVGATTKVIQLP